MSIDHLRRLTSTAARKTLARIHVAPSLEVRVSLHIGHYDGAELLCLRLHEWGGPKGKSVSPTDMMVVMPAASAAKVAAALQNAAEALSQSRRPVSPKAVRRDRGETRQAELRAKALDLNCAGKKPDDIAAELSVGRATVYRWLRDAAATAASSTPDQR